MGAALAGVVAHPKIAAAAGVGLVLVAASGALGWQRYRIRKLTDANTAAQVQIAKLTADLVAERANADLNRRLVRAELERERRRMAATGALLQRLQGEHAPVPVACLRVLDPLRHAVSGLRELGAGAGGARTPSASDLPGGPGAARSGDGRPR